jgi:putative ABC transport system permease protein
MGRLVRAALTQAARLIGTALAVALAVSLVSGTFILTDTISSAFARTSTTAAPMAGSKSSTSRADGAAIPGADVLVRAVASITAQANSAAGGEGEGESDGESLPESLMAKVAAVPGVKSLSAIVQGYAAIVYKAGKVVPGAAEPAESGQASEIDEISVQAEPGTSALALRASINAILPSSYEALTAAQVAEAAAQPWANSLGFLPDALVLLAAVSLAVGTLLIWNLFSILVAQRTRELGLLRALGASRAQLRRLVLAQATAIGLGASLAGILIGFGAAHGMLTVVRGAGMAVPSTAVVFRMRSAVAGVVCGVTMTAIAAFLPARRATLVSPVAALRGEETGSGRSLRRRVGPGAGVTLAGAALLAAGALHELPTPLATAVGGGVVLVGLALLLPAVAGPAAWLIGAPLVRLWGQPASLARQNIVRNPRRTAATAAALTIGLGLVGVVAIMGASMRASATSQVRQTLRADLVVTPSTSASSDVSSTGAPVGVAPSVVERLRQSPGVGVISEIGAGQWDLAGTPETLLAVDPTTVTQMHEVDPASTNAVNRLDDQGVLVRDTVAEHHGWKVGDVIPMTFALTGTRRLPIEGIFSTTLVRTDYVISLNALDANYVTPLLLEIDVKLAHRMPAAAAQADVRRALAGLSSVKVMDRSQLLASQQVQVDKLLTPLAAVLGLSVLIGLLGIGNALALSIHERTREIGLLRAVGMARSQLRTMIRCEAVIIAGVGSLFGLGLALGLGWVAVSALRDLGLTRLVFPVTQLGVLALAVTCAGMLAAILPARRAAGLQVLDAIHHVG